MIVCDNCKKIGTIAFPCFVALLKQEEKGKKDTDREVKRIPIDLCESCITAMIPQIGSFILNVRTRTPQEPTDGL